MEENILKKIADGIVDYAPSLAKVLTASGVGAPAGAALEVISSLGKAFGLGTKATPEAIQAAIAADPQLALKAMMAEQDFTIKQREKDIEEFKAALADKADARKLMSDETKITGTRDKSGIAFDWLIVVGFFATLLIYMFVDVDTDQAGNLGLLIGALISAFVTVVQFRRGSSMSSQRKTELLSKAEPIKE